MTRFLLALAFVLSAGGAAAQPSVTAFTPFGDGDYWVYERSPVPDNWAEPTFRWEVAQPATFDASTGLYRAVFLHTYTIQADGGTQEIEEGCSITWGANGSELRYTDIGDCLVPTPGPSGEDYFVLRNEAVQTVTIGTQTLERNTASGARQVSFVSGNEFTVTQSADVLAADGIGLVSWTYVSRTVSSGGGSDVTTTTNAQLLEASVGGTVYGGTATAAGSAPGTRSTLALTAAPNPVRGALRLTLDGTETPETPVTLSVRDALGRTVLTRRVTRGTLLDTSSLAAGVYLAYVEGDDARVRFTVAE